MSERKPPRLLLISLVAVALAGSAVFYFSRSAETVASEAIDKAQSSQKLQSLAELDGKAPSRRKLDVQTWNTAEGAKVLFVAAPELPMFDLRLIFDQEGARRRPEGRTLGPGSATGPCPHSW